MRRKVQNRLSIKELRLFSLLGSFGVSQLLQLLCATLRFPLIATSSDAYILGQIFLWVNIQTWGSVLIAGRVNVARISAQSSQSFMIQSRLSSLRFLAAILLTLTLVVYSALTTNLVWLGGLAPTLFLVTVLYILSPYYGFVQGLGKQNLISHSSSISAVVGLVITWLVTAAPFWSNLPESLKVLLVSAVGVVTILIPYFFSWLYVRRNFSLVSQSGNRRKALREGAYELAAVLPPAIVSGFDAFSLAILGKSDELAEYGLISRVALLTTFISSALYVQINNIAETRGSQDITSFLKDTRRLTLLSLPTSLLFVFLAPVLVSILSAGKVAAGPDCVLAIFVVSLVLPTWICASANILPSRQKRQRLGKEILAYVLPISFLSTISLAAFFGASGPFFASSLTYSICIVLATRLLGKTNK